MKYLKYLTYSVVCLAAMFAVSASAQGEKFSNPNVDYTFELPDIKWKMTVKPSAGSPNVEYVFGDRNDGHLEIRRVAVGANALMGDIVREEEQKLQFLPGFVAGKEENFGGFLKGSALNYEFVRGGRPMSGRFYFLRANPTTVYVLRFSGFTDKLRSIRHQTDSIARTFKAS